MAAILTLSRIGSNIPSTERTWVLHDSDDPAAVFAPMRDIRISESQTTRRVATPRWGARSRNTLTGIAPRRLIIRAAYHVDGDPALTTEPHRNRYIRPLARLREWLDANAIFTLSGRAYQYEDAAGLEWFIDSLEPDYEDLLGGVATTVNWRMAIETR